MMVEIRGKNDMLDLEDADRLFTISEVALILGFGEETVISYVTKGRLVATQEDGNYLFKAEHIKGFIDETKISFVSPELATKHFFTHLKTSDVNQDVDEMIGDGLKKYTEANNLMSPSEIEELVKKTSE